MTDLPDPNGSRAPVDAHRPAPARAADSALPQTTTTLASQPTRRQRALRVPNPRLFAGFPLVFLLLLLWWGATQSGLRTLLDLVAELIPGRFQVGHIEGR